MSVSLDDSQHEDTDRVVCPVTSLTLREKKVLVNSFEPLVKDGLHTVSASLITWSKENIAGMRDKFYHKDHGHLALSELNQQESFAAHSLVVLLTLNSLVSLVYKPDKLLTTMVKILLSHVHRHENAIDIEYFYRFGHSFSSYIQKQRHLEADDEEVLVWDKFMTSLIKAADKVVTSVPAAPSSSSYTEETEQSLARKRWCCTIL